MTRAQAFEECLGRIKILETKSKWASLNRRFKLGTLKEATLIQLLLKYGYAKTSEELWQPIDVEGTLIKETLNSVSKKIDEDMGELAKYLETDDKYYDIIAFDDQTKRFKIRVLKAESSEEAIKKVKGSPVDVTGDPVALVKFVNNTLDKYSK